MPSPCLSGRRHPSRADRQSLTFNLRADPTDTPPLHGRHNRLPKGNVNQPVKLSKTFRRKLKDRRRFPRSPSRQRNQLNGRVKTQTNVTKELGSPKIGLAGARRSGHFALLLRACTICFLAVGLAPAAAAQSVPDFKAQDMNPSSLRLNSLVSPRDYLLQVSGYYFGDAG
jgi:hypothetical protein